jgi:hypothetical protein
MIGHLLRAGSQVIPKEITQVTNDFNEKFFEIKISGVKSEEVFFNFIIVSFSVFYRALQQR